MTDQDLLDLARIGVGEVADRCRRQSSREIDGLTTDRDVLDIRACGEGCEMVPGSRRVLGSGSSRIRFSRLGAKKAPRDRADCEQRARDLIVMAAHDLRSPLAAIKMLVEGTIRRRRSGGERSAADWTATMSRVSHATDSAFSLIDDLLAVERLRMARGEMIARRAVDAEAVVREAISLHDDALRRAHCEVTLVRRKGLSSTHGRWDRGFLLRIFSNLLRNVTRHAPGAPVRVTFMRRGTRLGVVFVDHGSGLPTTAGEGAGRVGSNGSDAGIHGLGLWIVRRAVEGLRGSLMIQNEPGRGVAFDIELPGLQE